ncbi:hypothetical protein [Paenibacillus turpanensis]|uniref:hypothetical protein n=1 Tax=Paenibacillus turpanensis TaxID=2689078 RepID=UPI001409B613|nr:hypothetical protein [Paenibacillus turpanensis]
MNMETVTLASIVMRCSPKMYPTLKKEELESVIVLRDGLAQLEAEDALDIIKYSICEHQKQQLLQ